MFSYKDISYLLPTPDFSHVRIGAYPSQQQADELVNDGYSVFVDLTLRGETNQEYIIPAHIKYIDFPIVDRGVPISENSFFNLVQTIGKLSVLREEKVYVHCLGGHGRSGLLGVAFMIYLRYVIMKWDNKPITSLSPNIAASDACTLITEAHKERKIMKEIWRKRGVPQTKKQREYCVSYSSFIQRTLRR